MSIYKRPGRQHYYCKFKIGGQVFRFSTGTTSRRKAKVEETRLKAYHESRMPQKRVAGRAGLADIAGIDVAECIARNTTKGHQEDVEHQWGLILEHFGLNAEPRVINYDSVTEYMLWRREKAGANSIKREVWALKRGCQIAHRKGWLPNPPVEWPMVTRDKNRRTDRRSCTGKLHPIENLEAWLDELEQAPCADTEAFLEARLVLLTGLRSQEVKRLAADWRIGMMTDEGIQEFLHVPQWASKDRDERYIGLVDEALEILDTLGRDKTGEERMFSGAEHKRARERAWIRIGYHKTITLRDLRTHYLTYAVQGGDAIAAQASAGHSDLKTTQMYMRSTLQRQLDSARAVAGRVKPRSKRSKGAPKGGHQRAAVKKKATPVAIGQPESLVKSWSQEPDSNRRPADYESLGSTSVVTYHMSLRWENSRLRGLPDGTGRPNTRRTDPVAVTVAVSSIIPTGLQNRYPRL
ncbi:hypothetical protein ACFL6C_10600 [Myxococcota bacterium]